LAQKLFLKSRTYDALTTSIVVRIIRSSRPNRPFRAAIAVAKIKNKIFIKNLENAAYSEYILGNNSFGFSFFGLTLGLLKTEG